ncbi:MAG: SRPBCC family protein [Bacteroidia bacterium]
MYIVYIILGSLAGLIGIVLIGALFVKKGYHIQREVIIDRPVDVVYDYLRHLKNQDQFSVWVMKDPNKKQDFRGTDGTVGFVYAWDGNKESGAGEQEIKGLTPNKRIDTEVRFVRPMAAVAQTPFTLEAKGSNQTRVTWAMESAMKYPMNFVMLFLDFDKLLGKDMVTSLNTLKGILEK